MKVLYTALITIFVLSMKACALWTIIEFIIYIAKDTPFNWWSFWLTIISTVLLLITAALFAITEYKLPERQIEDVKQSFQDRIKALAKQRGKSIK